MCEILASVCAQRVEVVHTAGDKSMYDRPQDCSSRLTTPFCEYDLNFPGTCASSRPLAVIGLNNFVWLQPPLLFWLHSTKGHQTTEWIL